MAQLGTIWLQGDKHASIYWPTTGNTLDGTIIGQKLGIVLFDADGKRYEAILGDRVATHGEYEVVSLNELEAGPAK